MRSKYFYWRKPIGIIHLWLGMASGLVVVILGITGCLYCFIDEIRPIVYQDRIFIPANEQTHRVPLQRLREKADAALLKKVPLLDIEIHTDNIHTTVFRYRERNNKANSYVNYFINYYRVYMNPYTGKVIKVENTKWEFFNLVVMLHCCLLLGHLGTQIITWCTIIFMVMLVSGIYLWWPRNKVSSVKRFQFKWNKTTSWKRKNYDLHQILGFYVFIIAFFIALTGLAMLLPTLDKGIKYLVSGGKIREVESGIHDHHMMGTNYSGPNPKGIMDHVLNQAINDSPGISKFSLSLPKSASDPIKVQSYQEQSRHHADRIFSFNANTGALTKNQSFVALAPADQLYELYYDVHVGALLSFPGKILAFLVSLITASLPVSGFLIWKNRGKKTLINPAN
jgi:uncharacterized iron-regulated membrane protein